MSALAAFGGHLYASNGHFFDAPGAKIWRCQACDGSDWQKVADNGLGDSNNKWASALEVFEGQLYFEIGNNNGLQVWRTGDGTHWERVATQGFGDLSNQFGQWDPVFKVFQDHLYMGTVNFATGAEVWKSVTNRTSLPVVLKGQ
jgi:hypothetical protein